MKYNYDETPINEIIVNNENKYYIKRDDLIPFSFGGNKVRIAYEFMRDFKEKKCDCMLAYGNSRSNLCRVIANLCQKNNIDCYIISAIEDNDEDYIETNNSILVKSTVKKIFTCRKNEVANLIQCVKKKLQEKNKKVYYIYDKENEKVAFNAYIEAYKEIKKYEKNNNIFFDYIFFASGTSMTQTGLILRTDDI